MKQALIFKFWVIYDCLFPENYKNPSKIFSLVTFQLSPFFVFWSTKIQISLQPLGQMILKISPFRNSLINGFKMMQKSNNFEKNSNLVDLPNNKSTAS